MFNKLFEMRLIWMLFSFLLIQFSYGQPVDKTTGSRIIPEDAQKILEHHNKVRQEVGVTPLEWSSELAAYSQEWADHLAANGCRMEHRQQPKINDEAVGENLFWGSSSTAYHPIDASFSWYSEKKLYTYGKFGKGNWHAFGHYTQMIWKNTSKIGVGVAVCKNGEILVVANYYPAGNYVDQVPY
jgi:pathogenesis-related protein 1